MAVNPSAIWRVRPSGNNANGGGYDPGITSPGTDYSQQNAPQVTFNGTTITATTSGASNTITITGYTVATTDVANAIHITGGTNFTAGWYFITAVNTGASTWTLDRNCSSGAGSAMTGRMGGAWADPAINLDSALPSPCIGGNIVYILGSGIPNPASYTYDYTLSAAYFTPPTPSTTDGPVRLIGDPATPNFSTGGRPVISIAGLTYYGQYIVAQDLWFVANGATNSAYGLLGGFLYGVIFDQFGYDMTLANYNSGGGFAFAENVHCFSSVAKRSTNTLPVLSPGTFGARIVNCNISGCIGPGLNINYMATVEGCFITKNGGTGLTIVETVTPYHANISGNTIDANSGHGIEIISAAGTAQYRIYNNIISNHTTSGKYPIICDVGTTSQNDRLKNFIDYNVFYNNLNAPNAISYGPHDTTGGANPYTDQANGDYTLTSTYVNTGYPRSPVPGY